MKADSGDSLFEVRNLTLNYWLGSESVSVLKDLNFAVRPGEFVGIQGPSGSGKSTLFYVLGFLLKPSSGQVFFDGLNITSLSEDQLTLIRNRKIGFVFQQFHLLPKATAQDNILLPTFYPSEFLVQKEASTEGARQGSVSKCLALAKQLGLEQHLKHYPNQLSGGQQQRVAIARALMSDVDLILADEPTGNLDSKNAMQILDLLTELNRAGKTIILITHDAEVAKRCSRVYHLRDGAFTHSVENFVAPGIQTAKAQTHSAKAEVELFHSFRSWGSLFSVFRGVLPLVFENLIRNKVKSLLTMLGVVIGVAAVLAMVTLGQFAKQRILETYETMGVNKLVLRGYPNWNLKATDIVAVNFKSFEIQRDIMPLFRIFPNIQLISPVMTEWGMRVIAGGREAGDNKAACLGVKPEYFSITNRKLLMGRYLSPYHIEGRSPVCVIGHEIAERLFKRINPIGQSLSVTDGRNFNAPCQIIGVLQSVSSNKEWSPPNLNVFMPYTYFQTVVNGWNSQINSVALQMKPGTDMELAGRKLKTYFELAYGKSAQFNVDSDSTLIAQMKKFLNVFTALLTAIALLSLVVGGIGINNMMLVSVAERVREFGIRKALGATSQSLRIQVLMESMTLCLVAGVLGVAFGFTAYELMLFAATQFVPQVKFEWIFEPTAALLSCLAIGAVGVGSGLVPALKAEKLQVIEALRSD